MQLLHFAAILLATSSVYSQEKIPVSLDDVLNNFLGSSGFGGSWVPGLNSILRVISGKNVWQHNVETGANETIVSDADFGDRFNGSVTLSFSADREFILVEHSRQNVWRHSYIAQYDVYQISNSAWTIIQPEGWSGEGQALLQLVRWDPTGHSLVFIYENNIYYKKSMTDASVKVTEDGGHDIFNGISDWVYEEEMFGSPVAFWFSTDSSKLAFVKFDDTNVGNYSWPLYGEPGVRDTVYPEYEPIRYPKTGTENPEVSVHIVHLSDPETIKPVEYSFQDERLRHYVALLKWATASDLLVVGMNRQQTVAVWNNCNATGYCYQIHRQEQDNGWIDVYSPVISQNGDKFLTLQYVPEDTDSNRLYRHILAVNTSGSGQPAVLTTGAIHIDSILGWDYASNKIYFAGTGLHPDNVFMPDPSERHVYSVDSTGTNSVPTCISCGLRTGANEDCRSHSFTFSPSYAFFTHSCRGPGVPEITTRATANNSVIKVWQANEELRNRLNTRQMPVREEFEVDIAGGFKGKVRLHLPPNFDEAAKYALLVDVYAGPDSQGITQDYGVNWGTYLTSSKQIIYATIDGRGSGRQSGNLKFSVYRNLGSAEIEDQIAVTKHLIDNMPFIDARRTAIWGWSYGGYATAMALGKDSQNVFKCGIAVAPVTSWLYYDTIYTERYMGLPSDEDNWSGYNASSVMNHLENFRTKNFMLIHGNADDNVHYQQSMMLARAMEKADIMFYQLSYPEENHSINGPNMRRHLYHSIEQFLVKDCFGYLEPDMPPGTTTTIPTTTTPVVTTPVVTTPEDQETTPSAATSIQATLTLFMAVFALAKLYFN